MDEFASNTFNISLEPRHHMYCWLKSLNISKGNSNWKNVAVKVQLASSDQAPGTQFDDDMPTSSILTCDGLKSEYISVIDYHNRTPQFCDEVRIALPLPLSK